ncbi:MAG: DUF2313 domain-containing protein [Rhodospirillales bacterium]|nr:DUF2313 domain-containing protein [Rhodospirillales bacterium]
MSFLSSLGDADFGAAVRRLFPRGRAFAREATATVAGFAQAMGDAVFGLHGLAVLFLETEADPRYCQQTLTDWEADYGLPDPCTPPSPSTAQRRAALLAKIVGLGGQSAGYFIAVAQAMGYAITVTAFPPMRLPQALGAAMRPVSAVFYWEIASPALTARYFVLGSSVTGDPFWAVDDTSLECRLRQIAPADSVLIVSYGAGGAPLGEFILGVNNLVS